jgi:tetratricopeptide (TPR) repeat protein
MDTESITFDRSASVEATPVPPCGPSDDLARASVLLAAGEAEAATALLRGAPHRVASRDAGVIATLSAAAHDPEFLALVAEADGARDARQFEQGEFAYWRALNLYPLHYGYLTQYAHCLKEQGKWAEAEVQYRSALALGGPAGDLHRHIEACAHARGMPATLPGDAPHSSDPIDLPPTGEDVRGMLALFLHRGPVSTEEILTLLRDCPRRRDLALALVTHPDFGRANPDLMTLLARER